MDIPCIVGVEFTSEVKEVRACIADSMHRRHEVRLFKKAGFCRAQHPEIGNGGPCNRHRGRREPLARSK